MLTIENKDKIINNTITNEWYVEDIKELDDFNPLTNNWKPLYSITIRNRDNKYFEEIHLYRTKEMNGLWYELSCIRNGKKHLEYLSNKGIQNIKALLHHIKVVGID